MKFDKNLDFSPEELTEYIRQTGEIITNLYENNLHRRVFAGKEPGEIISLFDESLPENGTDIPAMLRTIEKDVIGSATLNVGPRYFGYITGGGNHASILAEMVSAALNQNNLKWHSSPVSTEIEKQVLKWVCSFIGYPETAAGAILDGGSTANFNCLAVARKNMAPQSVSDEGIYGMKPMTVYVSTEGHSSFDKAVDMLGLGKKYLRKIPVDDQFMIRTDLLLSQIKADREAGLNPICLIGIAGTTNSGAVDDLAKLAEIARTEKLWYHVDAAYGGPAAGIPSAAPLFKGMELADSVVINPHKWFYVPFEAACILVKEPDKLRSTFSMIPDYLRSGGRESGRTDMMEYQLPLTKSFKSLKVWMTFKTYGAKKLRELIQADIDKAKFLVDEINRRENFELLAPAPLSIVCFRITPPGMSESETERINSEIPYAVEQDGRVFLTGTKINGKSALRTCFINPRTTEKDLLLILDTVQDLSGKLY